MSQSVPLGHLPAHTPLQPARRARGRRFGLRLSIRDKILVSFLFAVVAMGLVTGIFVVPALRYNRQYVTMLDNANVTNQIAGSFKTSIDTAMWEVVAGKKEFTEGTHYQLMNDVEAAIRAIMSSTDSAKGRAHLAGILRTMETLRRYVDQLGDQVANDARVAENEAVLENIRGVSDLVQDLLQEYMIFEVDNMGQKALAMQSSFERWAVGVVLVIVLVTLFSIAAAWRISASIYLPIKRLHDVATGITGRDVAALVRDDNVDEITELGLSFNLMVGQIRDLLDAKVREQEQLRKAEFKALQAQINPHFLYNTLDTIIWKAEANQTGQVIDLVQALSSFFRITLSKGHDWINVGDEIEHVRSYLTIQHMRYRDILNYRIELEPDLQEDTILKLTLQPLVENAIYHGIKNKRGGGTIIVRGRALADDRLLFDVEDDGIGMTAERLAEVRKDVAQQPAFEADLPARSVASLPRPAANGVGLRNTAERVRLYYGPNAGLTIDSSPGRGTRVRLIIPRSPSEDAHAIEATPKPAGARHG